MVSLSIANTIIIDFTSFPDGSPIPDETPIATQFAPLGVIFQPLFPDSPGVKTDLGGILISGGPTGFFDDIQMDFGVAVEFVTLDIIGSGLDISAKMEAFAAGGASLGTVFHTYNGPTGQLSPFTFLAPSGNKISSLKYNGGLNPNAAASIGTLTFGVPDESSTLLLLSAGLVGILGYDRFRKRGAAALIPA